MDLLKLKIAHNKELLLLGYYKNEKIWQVLKQEKLRPNIWKSYFILKKNKKTKRIYSKKRKIELTKYFASTITFIALKLATNVDIINYVGTINGYHVWEAWADNSTNILDSVYIFYNYESYIVITDKKKMQEIEAYLLVQKTYKL